jgi:HK97 gp10 family phage protein
MARNVVTVKVEGLRESGEAIADLMENLGVSKATAKNTIKRALLFAVQPVEQSAEAMVKVRSGHLQASITSGTKLSRRQKSKRSKMAPVEVFVGAGPLPQAHMEEFGTAHSAPHPFLRPAVDRNLNAVRTRFSDQLKIEVEKTAARTRRKIERLRQKA